MKGIEKRLAAVEQRDRAWFRADPEVQQFIAAYAQATKEIAGDEAYQRMSVRIMELTGDRDNVPA